MKRTTERKWRGVVMSLLVSAVSVPALAGNPAPSEMGHPNAKSLGIYIGSELTEDGSTLLAGFGHEPSSHWIEIVPRQAHPQGATWKVGVTDQARIPGELIEIPQAEVTYKYISSNYSEFAGFPPPLTNGGLNEHGVAARDIWSPSRPELVERSETAAEQSPQTGPQYSDLAKAIMERATTAREAVEIIGGLIDEHGFSTYGGNSHLIADAEEGWAFINYAGGEGLWVAERLGPDEVRVMYPGYIHDFPVDHASSDDYLASDNFVAVAREQGWWDGEGESFNVQAVYGQPFPAEDPGDFYPAFYTAGRNPPERERELREMAPVSLDDMLAYVRDPRWSTDFSGYGQVAHLRPDVPPQLQTLWVAVTSAITTPFVGIPVGTEEVPPEFQQHRYMTKDADSHFIDPDYGPLEATRYATRTFKRLLYHTCEHPTDFLRPVTAELEAFERELIAERASVEQRALGLFEAGENAKARAHLTYQVKQRLLDGLALGEDLVRAVERETRAKYGIRRPEGEAQEGETTPATSQPMARHGWGAMIHCYEPALDEYPSEHGRYDGYAGLVP
ncbi:C69 family dipeptidase [Halomonas sp. NO4]|uniref:C69 family dipeptidase n=1 Tax=Halomonas sp. NO4 TaxID=2484813 RepID=UPI00196A0B34|nr:C69 family dipeptidase [Halomonas sp. NO4]